LPCSPVTRKPPPACARAPPPPRAVSPPPPPLLLPWPRRNPPPSSPSRPPRPWRRSARHGRPCRARPPRPSPRRGSVEPPPHAARGQLARLDRGSPVHARVAFSWRRPAWPRHACPRPSPPRHANGVRCLGPRHGSAPIPASAAPAARSPCPASLSWCAAMARPRGHGAPARPPAPTVARPGLDSPGALAPARPSVFPLPYPNPGVVAQRGALRAPSALGLDPCHCPCPAWFARGHGARRPGSRGPVPARPAARRLTPPLRGLPRPWRGPASAERPFSRPPIVPGALAAARPCPCATWSLGSTVVVPLRSAARARLSPGVCAARSRRVSAALRACMLAWCFGTTRLPPPCVFMRSDHVIYINKNGNSIQKLITLVISCSSALTLFNVDQLKIVIILLVHVTNTC
jgi:hypothetical protein